MVRSPAVVAAVLALLLLPASALADGCIFFHENASADLAQTKQEVVMAFHRLASPLGEPEAAVTYVLRTGYRGRPGDFAWVIPLPATPEEVVAHEDTELFEKLDRATGPRFLIPDPDGKSGFPGCGCMGGMRAARDPSYAEPSVTVEARGEAGIYSWAALRSTGAGALLDWLRTHRYAIPPAAGPVLDRYIRQGMRFLAVRVGRPREAVDDGGVEVPPVQFTCRTERMYYPMAISRISAAETTEVVLHVIHPHRVGPANLPGLTIDPRKIVYDPEAESMTTYEQVFREAVEREGGLALVTEYAAPGATPFWHKSLLEAGGRLLTIDPDGGGPGSGFLTRMRTVVARHRMDRDFEFRVDARDHTVNSVYYVTMERPPQVAAIAADPLFLLLVFGFLNTRCRRRRSRCGSRSRR